MALISLWMSWAFDKECPFATQSKPDVFQLNLRSILHFYPKFPLFMLIFHAHLNFTSNTIHAQLDVNWGLNSILVCFIVLGGG